MISNVISYPIIRCHIILCQLKYLCLKEVQKGRKGFKRVQCVQKGSKGSKGVQCVQKGFNECKRGSKVSMGLKGIKGFNGSKKGSKGSKKVQRDRNGFKGVERGSKGSISDRRFGLPLHVLSETRNIVSLHLKIRTYLSI